MILTTSGMPPYILGHRFTVYMYYTDHFLLPLFPYFLPIFVDLAIENKGSLISKPRLIHYMYQG